MKLNSRTAAVLLAIAAVALSPAIVSACCDYGVQQQIVRAPVYQAQDVCTPVVAAPAYQVQQQIVQAAPVYQAQVFAAPVYASPVVVRQQAVYAAPAASIVQRNVYSSASVVQFSPVRSRGIFRGRGRSRSVGVAQQAVAGGGGVNINASGRARVRVR
jgi:hypothetical protein